MLQKSIEKFLGRQELLFSGLLLVALWAGVVGIWRAQLSSDMVMYSVGGDEVLKGARLYIDIIDINPPLIFYIHAFFSLLARLSGLDSLQLFIWTVLAGSGLSSLLVYRYLREEKWSWLAANAPAWVSLFALYTFEFGEREHIFSLAFLPYITARWYGGRNGAVKAIALVAAVLACLKPNFFALLVVFEALAFYRDREWKVYWWAFLAAPLALYLLHFLAWSPAARKAFGLDLVPEVVRLYRTFNMPLAKLLRSWSLVIATYFPLALYLIFAGRRRKDFSFVAGWLALVALSTAFLQHKGWDYHLLPAQFLLALGTPALWFAASPLWPEKIRNGVTGLLLLAQAIYAVNHFKSFPEFCEREFHAETLKAVAHRGDSVIIFSPQPLFSFPVFRDAGLKLGSRYLFVFPIGFFLNWPPAKEEQAFVRAMRADIDEKNPDLLVFPATLPLQWPLASYPYKTLEYAVAKGIFDVHDPRYSLVLQDAHWTIFRRKLNQ